MSDSCRYGSASVIQDSYRTTNAPNKTRFYDAQKRAVAHVSRLKAQMPDLNRHVAHPRPLRDVSSIQRDFDTALDATAKLQRSHMDLQARRQKEGYYCQSMRKSFIDEGSMTKEGKYPMNNPVFNTIWQKLFANKNGGMPVIDMDPSDIFTKDDPAQDQQRMVSRFKTNEGGLHFCERSFVKSRDSGRRNQSRREKSFSHAIDHKDDIKDQDKSTKESRSKKELAKMVGVLARNPNIPKPEARETNKMPVLIHQRGYNTEISPIKTRNVQKSFDSKEYSLEMHYANEKRTRYETTARKNMLLRLDYVKPLRPEDF